MSSRLRRERRFITIGFTLGLIRPADEAVHGAAFAFFIRSVLALQCRIHAVDGGRRGLVCVRICERIRSASGLSRVPISVSLMQRQLVLMEDQVHGFCGPGLPPDQDGSCCKGRSSSLLESLQFSQICADWASVRSGIIIAWL